MDNLLPFIVGAGLGVRGANKNRLDRIIIEEKLREAVRNNNIQGINEAKEMQKQLEKEESNSGCRTGAIVFVSVILFMIAFLIFIAIITH